MADRCETVRCSLSASEGKRRTARCSVGHRNICLWCVTHPIAVHGQGNSSDEA